MNNFAALLATLTLVSSPFSHAARVVCRGEALLQGTVKSVKMETTSCQVFLTEESQIQQSQICPIDPKRIATLGITLPLRSPTECWYLVGQKIKGMIVDDGRHLLLQ